MYRIDDASAATSLPAPEAARTEGYWTEGNPGSGVPATLVRASWLNMIQEELRAVVVAGGLTPSKTTYNQVLTAINALIVAAFTGANQQKSATSYQKLPGGFILQMGAANLLTTGDGGTTFGTPFPNICLGVWLQGGSNAPYIGNVQSSGPTGFNASMYTTGGARATPYTYYLAIGY